MDASASTDVVHADHAELKFLREAITGLKADNAALQEKSAAVGKLRISIECTERRNMLRQSSFGQLAS